MKLDIGIKKKLGDFFLDIDYHGDIDTLGILGASGCGKSLTLKCIAGIEKPDEGHIAIDGRIFFDSEKRIDLKPRERRVGYLFQNYALFPNMTVVQNITAPLGGSRQEKLKAAAELIKTFCLEGLEEHLPRQLSGGQQQRVALARMMAAKPELILLDEPFSALDIFLKDRLMQELIAQLNIYEAPFIMVSHDRDEVYRLCQKTAVMDEGIILRADETGRVFENPMYRKAASLTGCKNILEIKRRDAHTAYLPAWDTTLCFEEGPEIPDGACALGIRAHDLIPLWEEPYKNALGVELSHTAELQFERHYYFTPELCWFVHRELLDEIEKKGVPPYLGIPGEKVMWLK